MNKSVTRALRAALAIILVFVLAGTSALASISVRFNASAKVYKSASTSAKYVKAPKNLKVTLVSYKNGWGKISYKGKTGYVQLKYLDRTSPVKAYTNTSATVYRDAGSNKLGSVSAGTTVYVLGVNGSYSHVQNKSGSVKGYIKTSQLTSKAPSSASSSSSAASAIPASLRSTTTSNSNKIEYTIYVAQNLIGTPYASNANPPKTFDCAKYAYYCYTKAKTGCIGGSSYSMGYDDRYAKIAYADLKRGDLVCFDTIADDDLSDHVGIYLGSGYFLHASSAGGKVILSSLSSGYYNRTFSWGRRIFD